MAVSAVTRKEVSPKPYGKVINVNAKKGGSAANTAYRMPNQVCLPLGGVMYKVYGERISVAPMLCGFASTWTFYLIGLRIPG